ncbi:MAG: CbiQ family ECF transporter T component [Planctomycetota bacterium]
MNAAAVDPRIRILLAGGAVAAASLLQKHQWERFCILLAAEAAVAATLALAGRLQTIRFCAVFGATAAPAFLFCIFALFRTGHPIFTIAPGFVVSAQGVIFSIGLFLASAVSSAALALLAATTSAQDARRALRAFGIPEAVLSILTFMARRIDDYFFDLDRSRRAVLARGGASAGRLAFLTNRGRLANLFVISVERGIRTNRSLAARGFAGSIPDPPLAPVPTLQIAIGAAGVVAFLLLIFIP